MAGTILHCRLIVTEWSLLSTSVDCHLVSRLGTVGLMKQHVFSTAPKHTLVGQAPVQLDWYTVSGTYIQRKKRNLNGPGAFYWLLQSDKEALVFSVCLVLISILITETPVTIFCWKSLFWRVPFTACEGQIQLQSSSSFSSLPQRHLQMLRFQNVSCVLCLKLDGEG